MTLEEFSQKIIKPTLIKDIRQGRLDNALLDIDCLEIILKDAELIEAYKYRMENSK